MTAEVAIMNKRAVALAADSAVTIGHGSKFHNSVNKLFMLSKYHPVGIMVYSAADFMGVPWELIIKQFRKHIKKQSYATLEEYITQFFSYINNNNLNFKDYEDRYVYQITNNLLRQMSNKIDDRMKEKISNLRRPLEEHELIDVYREIIHRYSHILNNHDELDSLPADHRLYIKDEYESAIKQIIEENLDIRFIPHDLLDIAVDTATKIFCKKIFVNSKTGIVITGFGEEDVFPKLYAYDIEGQINGFTKYKETKNEQISNSNTFSIIPFAQTDTVQTFMRGISPTYLGLLENYLKRDVMKELEPNGQYEVSAETREYLKDKLDSTIGILKNYSSKEYVQPIARSVPTLPTEELAEMAESLVNLTSFRRQVSIDDNMLTVGGPIDVAIISKYDGFIWIKRKHYFKREYNEHFFNSYYDEE